MTQRLDHLEDDRVAQRPVRSVELALGHDPLGELAGRHLPVHLEMARADIGDLALLEEAVADHVAGPPMLRLRVQPERRVDVRKIVPGLRDLRFIGRNPTVDLGTLVLQRLDDKSLAHALLNRRDTGFHQSPNRCISYLMPRRGASPCFPT